MDVITLLHSDGGGVIGAGDRAAGDPHVLRSRLLGVPCIDGDAVGAVLDDVVLERGVRDEEVRAAAVDVESVRAVLVLEVRIILDKLAVENLLAPIAKDRHIAPAMDAAVLDPGAVGGADDTGVVDRAAAADKVAVTD